MYNLAILIPTLTQRSELLNRLLYCLEPQITDDVKIFTLNDEQSTQGLTIGDKRNQLVSYASEAHYSVFIDDDDLVSKTYVQDILEAIKTHPDVVGMNMLRTLNDKFHCVVRYSIKNKCYYKELLGDYGVFNRTPTHICPIKTSLIQQVKFPSINIGEDQEFAKTILPLLKTEVFVNKYLYYYLYKDKP